MPRRTLPQVAPLLAGAGLLFFGGALQTILLPLRGQLESFGAFTLGAVGSCYSAGFLVGCVLGSRIVTRVGHIRAFGAMVAIASSVVLLHAVFVSPLAWWILRAATGGCYAVLYMVIESWLNDKAVNSNRGAVFAVYAMVGNAMMMTGQLSVALFDPRDVRIFMLGSIMMSLAAVPVALSRRAAPGPVDSVRLRPRRILRISPVAFIGCFCCGLVVGAVGTLLPVYGSGIGLGTTGIALLCASGALAAAVGTWPLGFLSDRLDRRVVMIGAAVCAAAAGLFLARFGQAGAGFAYFGVIAYGAFAVPIHSISIAHANDHVSPSEFVETAGGLSLTWATGTLFGPMMATGFMNVAGPAGLFLATAFVHLTLAGHAAWRISRRPTPNPRMRAAFHTALTEPDPLAPMNRRAASGPREKRNAA
jgi:MFS family permease